MATLRVLLVASLPEMRTAHARMSIDGICVQVRGNVQLGVSLARNSIWRTSTKGEAHFCISRVRNAVAPNKKAASRRFKFCWGNIAARIRSLNFVGKVTGVPVPVLAQTPLLGILVRFRGILRIKFLIVAVLVITCNGNRAFGEVKLRVNWRYLANLRAQK